MKKLMIIALLTVVPSALHAETAADKRDLGAARESASVDFDMLTAKDAGPSVALPNVGPSVKNDVPLVLTESKKKALPSAVSAISERKSESGIKRMLGDERATGVADQVGAQLLLFGLVTAGAVIGSAVAGPAGAAVGVVVGLAIAVYLLQV